jgi:voltage-gated potassium channel
VTTIWRRIRYALLAISSLIAIGTLGYRLLGGGRWSIGECLYMTVITVATVGFSELPHMHDVAGARAFTIALIVGGVSAFAYVQGNLTALFVEGVVGQAWRKNRMKSVIEKLVGHVVVAGAGTTGRHVIEELVATRTPFVVIDKDEAQLLRMDAELCNGKLLYVLGDATDDHVLEAANVGKAKGIVAALTLDKDNLFVTLSARSLAPEARIVSKVVEDATTRKLLKAGATSVVSPAQIGGRRMVSELIRPQVTEFLDQMLRDKEKNLRIDEVTIPEGSPFDGQFLKDAPIRKETSLLVVAVRALNREFVYNPDPETKLISGMTLVVLGDVASVAKLRALVTKRPKISLRPGAL